MTGSIVRPPRSATCLSATFRTMGPPRLPTTPSRSRSRCGAACCCTTKRSGGIPPAPWLPIEDPLLRRLSVQTFGVVGLGRIGTAAALRAKALGFRVVFYDPYLPNGTDLAIGVGRAPTLPELLRQADVLSIHAPLTRHTRGLIGRAELELLPRGAVVVNTARGPILDLDALGPLIRSGQIAGAGLDVVPVEPPVEPVPELLRAYRAREPWLEGRLIVTPHSAYWTPEAARDIRVKSAETMRAALTDRPQNVITPEMD